MQAIGAISFGIFITAALYALWQVLSARQRVYDRLYADVADDRGAPRASEPEAPPQGRLRRWLALAGYRHRAAPLQFIAATLVSIGLGTGILVLVSATGLVEQLVLGASTVPGGMGDVAVPLLMLLPWGLLVGLALVPWLFVRRVRRTRVEQIEQDLPITLELLSTLSESGLGFDAGISRLFETRLAQRPLALEFRTLQADLLAGRSRVFSLRRLAQRVDVPSMTIFVSALVQAEQVGMGIADVLRRQADDMRIRRRERANAFAMSLPVKLMFPLVICFLPGLFVWTLGPVFIRLFQIADSLLQNRTF